ncbi:MAG: DEAD/DEAH box helicase [Candidatus Saccharibacteria bacterium]|nr:DEAD/DEAH box helicase [Candidatus Saccharibacteria bacterium]
MPQYQQRRRPTYGRANYPRANRSASRAPKKEYINPAKFIQPAKPIDETPYVPTHMFADFDLHPGIHRNLEAMGYTAPSPIQDQTIPSGLAGKDVVGIANTGTGKTAAFAIPLLNRLIADPGSTALIMAPTRELAQQIEEQCRLIAKGSGLRGAILIGGVSMGPQQQDLRNKPRIIIGTPGRIKDHSERRTLNLAQCNIIVLDEVDRMLDMGFVNDIRHILSLTNPEKQSYYFSATLDARVRSIIETFSADPVHVAVKTADTSENVDQNVVVYKSRHEKLDILHALLAKDHVVKTLVFDDTHHSVEQLSKELAARGFQADAIHGGKSQSQRQRALKRFKDNHISVLVATDVAARGIDVSDITHVINYSLPQSYSDYAHRIGRAGRAGRQGHALTFIEG